MEEEVSNYVLDEEVTSEKLGVTYEKGRGFSVFFILGLKRIKQFQLT